MTPPAKKAHLRSKPARDRSGADMRALRALESIAHSFKCFADAKTQESKSMSKGMAEMLKLMKPLMVKPRPKKAKRTARRSR